jgi:hypothetical protein
VKKMTKAEIAALQKRGANVTTIKEARKADPKPEQTPSVDQMSAVFAAIASELARSQSEGMSELAKALQRPPTKSKPTPFRLIIKRNRRGLIEEIDAYPIVE